MVGSQSMLVRGANAVLSQRVQTPGEVFISKPCTCRRKVWRSLPWPVWKIFGYFACRFCSGYQLANVQNMLASAEELIDTAITCINISYITWKLDVDNSITRHSFNPIQHPLFLTKKIRKEHPSFAKMWMIGGQIHMEKRVAPMAGGIGNLSQQRVESHCSGKGFNMSRDGRSEILELCERMGMWLNLVPFLHFLILSPSRPVVYWQIHSISVSCFVS